MGYSKKLQNVLGVTSSIISEVPIFVYAEHSQILQIRTVFFGNYSQWSIVTFN